MKVAPLRPVARGFLSGRVFASPRLGFAVLLGMLMLGNLWIFRDFILGDHYLLFEDLGCDSVHHNLPVMYYLSQPHAAGRFWIHGSVLGNNVFLFPWMSAFNPILPILGWHASVSEFAGRLVYYPILQSLLAGSFFYWFLLRSGSPTIAAILSSCGFALCGAYTATATWMVMLGPPLLAGLAIVLWAYKVWQQQRRWWAFSIAVAHFALSTQPLVTVYQLAVFLALYLVYDSIMTSGATSWRQLRSLLSDAGRTAVAGGIGLLGVAFWLLPHAYYVVFHNSRPPTAGASLVALPTAKDVLAVWLRLYSNDLLGTANLWTYRYNHSNYMELPFLYGGLLLIVVIPTYALVSCYRGRSRRELLALSVLVVPLALAQVLPGLRAGLLFAGTGTYHRWSSLFTIAALTIAGNRALAFLLVAPGPRRAKVMALTAVTLLLVGGLSAVYLGMAANGQSFPEPRLCLLVGGMVVGYALLLHMRGQRVRYVGLLALLLAELSFQGQRTVSEGRQPLRKLEGEAGDRASKMYSNPSILRSLELVRWAEAGDFSRVSKTPEYPDIVDNSALVQDYYGTRGYTTFNNPATVAFFENRGLTYPNAPYLPGFRGRHLLDVLVGVKYYIQRGELPRPPWALYLTRVGRVTIYRNPRAFPLGVTYDDYMLEREFDALPFSEEDKDRLLLSAAIVSDGAAGVRASEWAQRRHLTAAIAPWNSEASLEEGIRQKQRGGLQLTSIGRDALAGRIVAERPGILFVSIPYDPGWHVRIDGQEVEKLRVQIGFLGALLPAGNHAVQLEYRPPYYRAGLALSLATAAGMLVAGTVFRRRVALLLGIGLDRPEHTLSAGG